MLGAEPGFAGVSKEMLINYQNDRISLLQRLLLRLNFAYNVCLFVSAQGLSAGADVLSDCGG